MATLSGIDNLLAVVAGTSPWPIPAAQGPEAAIDGALRIRGPFTITRHPLNLAPLAPFWLTPHMTTRRLTFNVVATAYLIVGSIHEEKRLLRQYGDRYETYRNGDVPFYGVRSPATSPYLECGGMSRRFTTGAATRNPLTSVP